MALRIEKNHFSEPTKGWFFRTYPYYEWTDLSY